MQKSFYLPLACALSLLAANTASAGIKIIKDTRYIYDKNHHLMKKEELPTSQFPKIENASSATLLRLQANSDRPIHGEIIGDTTGSQTLPISRSPIHLSIGGFRSLDNSSWGWPKDAVMGPFLDKIIGNQWVDVMTDNNGSVDFSISSYAARALWKDFYSRCGKNYSSFDLPSVYPLGEISYVLKSPTRVKTYQSKAYAKNSSDKSIKVIKTISLTYNTETSTSRSQTLTNASEWSTNVSVSATAGVPDVAEVGVSVETGVSFSFETQNGTESTKTKAYSFTDEIQVEAEVEPHKRVEFTGVVETYDVPLEYKIPLQDRVSGSIYALDDNRGLCHKISLPSTRVSAKSKVIGTGVVNAYAVNTAVLVSS